MMCEKMYSAMEISELRMLSKENCGDYVFRYVEKYVVGSTYVTFCQKFSLIFIVDFRFYRNRQNVTQNRSEKQMLEKNINNEHNNMNKYDSVLNEEIIKK